jgi:predicted RNase H-like HicB family nuclease
MAKSSTTKAKPTRTETVRSATYRYTVHFEPAEEGGYIVKVPALNGIATQGETLEEARAMAEDLIRGYLQSLRKHGEPIPVEHEDALTTRIAVSLAGA